MINHTREIEAKFKIVGWTLEDLFKDIMGIGFVDHVKSLVVCNTKDVYFPAPGGVDIIRLRDSWGLDNEGFSKQLKEITVKVKDQGNNFNRLEENIKIDDSSPAFRSLSLVFGDPVVTLEKREKVIWTSDGMVISIASVNHSKYLYLEIEGPSEELVRDYSNYFNAVYLMTREDKSLLEIHLSEIQ